MKALERLRVPEQVRGSGYRTGGQVVSKHTEFFSTHKTPRSLIMKVEDNRSTTVVWGI